MSTHQRSRLAPLRSRLKRFRSALDHASHRRIWVRSDKRRGDAGEGAAGEGAAPQTRVSPRTPTPTG